DRISGEQRNGPMKDAAHGGDDSRSGGSPPFRTVPRARHDESPGRQNRLRAPSSTRIYLLSFRTGKRVTEVTQRDPTMEAQHCEIILPRSSLCARRSRYSGAAYLFVNLYHASANIRIDAIVCYAEMRIAEEERDFKAIGRINGKGLPCLAFSSWTTIRLC